MVLRLRRDPTQKKKRLRRDSLRIVIIIMLVNVIVVYLVYASWHWLNGAF